jgi:hypothetical protein
MYILDQFFLNKLFYLKQNLKKKENELIFLKAYIRCFDVKINVLRLCTHIISFNDVFLA